MRRFNLFKTFPLFLALGFLTACGPSSKVNLKNSYTEQDLFHDEVMGEPPQLLTLQEVFELTPEQKDHFLKNYHNFKYRDLSDSQRIYEFLKDQLDSFNFHSDTLVATDAMAQNSGNCLSLAILTKALAQLTNVGVSYELARTPPVFQREGDLLLSSQHIRAVIYDKNSRNTKQFIKPNLKIKVDYFSTVGSRMLRRVNKEEFYAMFYSNRAAEAMVEGNYKYAYWHLKEALKHDNDNVIAINILGVIYRRLGLMDYAERTFQYGIASGENQLELLNNYHKLLVQQNRLTDAAVIAKKLENYDDPDPFKWIDLADAEMREGNYNNAIKLFNKAAEKASYLHQPYAGIAKANFYLGRTERAIRAIELAIEHSHRNDTTSLYEAKYDYFKSLEKTN